MKIFQNVGIDPTIPKNANIQQKKEQICNFGNI